LSARVWRGILRSTLKARDDIERRDSIAIVAVTHNRVHLLRQCVENVLLRTSDATTEIVIWDNASTDGTKEYLAAITDPRIRVVHHPTNVGVNGYAIAFPQTTAEYLIDLDDDLVDAPPNWDAALLAAYKKLPKIGFLAAKLADDDHDPTAQRIYRDLAHLYETKHVNGVRILEGGPVGGACTITSRELHDRVGGFKRSSGAFFHEDHAFIRDIKKLGYRAAILDEIVVTHHGGPYYSEIVPEKVEYYKRRNRKRARKALVKRVLLAIPFVGPLNRRYRWFQPPQPLL
jgi:O-antigen biosynthesis protein